MWMPARVLAEPRPSGWSTPPYSHWAYNSLVMAIRQTNPRSAGAPIQRKDARLSLRANPRQESLIRRAAEAEGKTVTSFVLDSATATALQVLADQRMFLIGSEAWDEFLAALDRPVTRKPRLEGLLRNQDRG